MTGVDLGGLGRRIRAERGRRALSLEGLAARSKVSRSMLSDVERGRKAPTVLVLDHIATALDTTIARLLGEERTERVIVLRRAAQDVAADPTGWERRILSPVLPGVEFELMRTTIPGGVDAGVFAPHAPGTREYLAVERGRLRLTLDDTPYVLEAGDSVYYAGDCHHGFANPGAGACVYYLAMAVAGDVGGRSHRLIVPARARPSPTSATARGRARGSERRSRSRRGGRSPRGTP